MVHRFKAAPETALQRYESTDTPADITDELDAFVCALGSLLCTAFTASPVQQVARVDWPPAGVHVVTAACVRVRLV